MPRRNIVKVFAPESYYHIYNRGVNKELIFKDKHDIDTFMRYLVSAIQEIRKDEISLIINNPNISEFGRSKLLKEVNRLNFFGRLEIVAYCLMPNHFHFLVFQADEKAMTEFMRSLVTRYCMYFNRRHKRVGPVFQGAYKAVRIKDDPQMLQILDYIHRNYLEDLEDNLKGIYPSSYDNYHKKKQDRWLRVYRV